MTKIKTLNKTKIMKQMKTILNKKIFFLFFLLGSINSIQSQLVQRVVPSETFCQGFSTARNYAVDTADGPKGTPGSTYVWSVTGTNAPNPIYNTDLTITNAITINWASTPAGSYVVHVIETNNGCPATEVLLDVIISPLLTASVSIATPSSTTFCAGTSVTFTATPTNGGSTPSYQWYVGLTAIGSNSPTFTSNSLSNNDIVTVVMTSNASPCLTGSPATSNPITVTVNPILTASVSIASPSATFCAGTSVTFTATPTNGGTPTYQWKVNDTDVSGQTAVTFTSNSLSNNDIITVVMTSNASPCLAGSPATSSGITVNITTVTTSAISHD